MKITNKKPKEDQIYYYKDGKCCISSDNPLSEELMVKYGNPEAKSWIDHCAIINPPKSDDELFAEEMDALNDKHYQDVLDATNSYDIAKARDGSTETKKVIAARAKLADIDAQYEIDQLAIIDKYYGA